MKKYDFYLAGPFFTPEQLELQEDIEKAFKIMEKKIFSPRLDAGKLEKDATKEDMLKVFEADLSAIDNCGCLFANISYRDTGTSVEIGYALAKGIPVILFWDKNRHDTEKVNLMLALACKGAVIQDWMDLPNFLLNGIIPNNEFKFNVE